MRSHFISVICLQTKAVAGVRQAYRLSKTIQDAQFTQAKNVPPVRGYRIERPANVAQTATHKVSASDAQANLAPLYTLLRSSRQTRRSLLYSMLRMFDDSAVSTICVNLRRKIA